MVGGSVFRVFFLQARKCLAEPRHLETVLIFTEVLKSDSPPTKLRCYKTKSSKIDHDIYCCSFNGTSNTHNPRWKSLHKGVWNISRLFTHFSLTSLLLPALGSETGIFCLLGVGKSVYRYTGMCHCEGYGFLLWDKVEKSESLVLEYGIIFQETDHLDEDFSLD